VLSEGVVAELAGRLAERARAGGPVGLTGPGGLLSGIIGQVLQAGLAAELDAHLDGDEGGNRRNGSGAKTLNIEVGPVRIAVPRDREGSFDPVLVPKQATLSDGLNAVITSLYAKGMSVRDIARHVRQTAGVELSHDTVSRVTDGALEAMREWQHRPLEPFYPVIYVDALVAKVRDGAAVRNNAVNIAVGIDPDGAKRVLGIWVAPGEGAKTWAQALAQLRNRGVEEVLFVCCDGLSGLGDEIVATWPGTMVQTCTVHLIRRSLGYASYNDREAIARALKEVYTACDADAPGASGPSPPPSATSAKPSPAVTSPPPPWQPSPASPDQGQPAPATAGTNTKVNPPRPAHQDDSATAPFGCKVHTMIQGRCLAALAARRAPHDRNPGSTGA
jgi:putative transposase